MITLLMLLACSGEEPIAEEPVAAPAPAEAPAAAPVQGIAQPLEHALELVELLRKGDNEAAAERFHVPADADVELVAAEREGLGNSLAVIVENVGQLMLATPKLQQEQPTYDLRLTSMDGDYWSTYASPQPTAVAYFDAEYSLGGTGTMRVGYFEVDGEVVMQGVVFGLVPSPETRSLAIQTLRKLMVSSGVPDSASLMDELERSMPVLEPAQ